MRARGLRDFAAGTNVAEQQDGEAGGVGDVTKQLEQQTLEDKEKEDDGEEGTTSSHHQQLRPLACRISLSAQFDGHIHSRQCDFRATL